jgi:hypothetical protein
MSTSLDTILSGREPASAAETTQDVTTQPAPEVSEVEPTTEQQPEAHEGSEPSKDGKQPPIGAIRQAERDKADKRYTAVLDGLRTEIATRDAAWEQRVARLMEAQKPKAEPRPAPDIFEDANGAILHTVQPHLTEMRQVLMHNSRLIAEQRHTEDAVSAADAAFSEAHAKGQLDPAEAQRVLSSPNIYDAAVKWHRRQQAQAEIGDDPAAFKERLRKELMAELQANGGGEQPQAQQEQPAARVMPSNFATARNVGARSGPAWAGPTSLNDIFKR